MNISPKYRLKSPSKFIVKKVILALCIINGPVREVIIYSEELSFDTSKDKSDNTEEDYREDLSLRLIPGSRRYRHSIHVYHERD